MQDKSFKSIDRLEREVIDILMKHIKCHQQMGPYDDKPSYIVIGYHKASEEVVRYLRNFIRSKK